MSVDIMRRAIDEQDKLPLWLIYLWQRLHDHKRLGFVLGAGVSIDAGCPSWPELINRLTKSMKIPARRMKRHKKMGLTDTFLAEVLFRHHRDREEGFDKQFDERDRGNVRYRKIHIDASWREVIHKSLYKEIDTQRPFSEIVKNHRYIDELAQAMYTAGFAVTFNFDDIVDEAVINFARLTKGPNPEVITSPKVETRKGAPVIYHINGVLPREGLRRSEKVVLTEDAFADILISPGSSDAEFVVRQFSTRTFILLGASLADNSLTGLSP